MIRIGTSGWKYKDWDGIVYPKPKPRGFDELAYLAQYLNTIEINTSYYGPPRASSAKKWVESVAPNTAFQVHRETVSFVHALSASPRRTTRKISRTASLRWWKPVDSEHCCFSSHGHSEIRMKIAST